MTFNANPIYQQDDEANGEAKYKDELYDTVHTDNSNKFLKINKFSTPFAESARTNLPLLNQKGMRSTILTGNQTQASSKGEAL